jgi:hypothetical protein
MRSMHIGTDIAIRSTQVLAAAAPLWLGATLFWAPPELHSAELRLQQWQHRNSLDGKVSLFYLLYIHCTK